MRFYGLFAIVFSLISLYAAEDSTTLEQGKYIYEETCISCHGADGQGNEKMHLVVKPRVLQRSILTQQQMFLLIRDGAHAYGAHADIMPAFKYVYSDKQIEAVAYYVTKMFNSSGKKRQADLLAEAVTQPISAKKEAALGAKIFKKKCAMCHGSNGNGESEYVEQSKDGKDFIYPYNLQKILLQEEQIFLYAKYGGHFWGTAKNDMPSWKRKYNDTALKAVAKYIENNIKSKAP